MDGKIALEEHFAIDDALMDSAGYLGEDVWAELESRLLDIHGRRIELMDRHGIETMILSLNVPAASEIWAPMSSLAGVQLPAVSQTACPAIHIYLTG